MSNKIVVISGMHRSGTSLVASIIQDAGVNIGQELLPSEKDNKFGFFEDRDFQEFHEKVMHQCGYDYLLKDDINLSFNENDRTYARKLVHARSGLAVWGWKDPRTLLFLNEWDKILTNSKYLFVFRSPHEVVMSLINRAGPRALRKIDSLFDVWHLYNLRLYEFYKLNPDKVLLCNIHGLLDNRDHFFSLLKSRFSLDKTPRIHALFEADLLNRITLPDWADTYLRSSHPESMSLYDKMQKDCDIPLSRQGSVNDLQFSTDLISLFNKVNVKWMGHVDNIIAGSQKIRTEDKIGFEEKYHEMINSKPMRISRVIKKNRFLYPVTRRAFMMAEEMYRKFAMTTKAKPAIDTNKLAKNSSAADFLECVDNVVINIEADTEYAHINKDFDCVVHIYYKGMHGVQSAVSYLPGKKVGIPFNQALNSKEIARIVSYIADNFIEHIVIHGYSVGYADLIKTLKSEVTRLKIYSVWHGGPSQFLSVIEYNAFGALLDLRRVGDLDQLANVKVGMSAFSSDIFPGIIYNFSPNVECVARHNVEEGSVFIPLREIYRKNLYSNILASVISNDISKVYAITDVSSFNGHLSMEKISIVNKNASLNREEMFRYYSAVSLVLNVTLAECQPMVMLEALAHNTPCLIGPNAFGELDSHEYKQLIEVIRPDVLPEILQAIARIKALQNTDAEGLAAMMQDYQIQATQLATLSYERLFDF